MNRERFIENTPLNIKKTWKCIYLNANNALLQNATINNITYTKTTLSTIHYIYALLEYNTNKPYISFFNFKLPDDYIKGSDIKIKIAWTTNNPGKVVWEAGLAGISSDYVFENNIDIKQLICTSISNDSNYYHQVEDDIIFNGENIVSGENLSLFISRRKNFYADDTINGKCYISSIIIYYLSNSIDSYYNRDVKNLLDFISGSFEGEDLESMGWIRTNDTNGSNWHFGPQGGSVSGENSLWIGSNNTTYGGVLPQMIRHIYKDITIPKWTNKITLQFYVKYPIYDPNNDYLDVYITNPTNTPVDNHLPDRGYIRVFKITDVIYNDFVLVSSIDLSKFSGEKIRLVFTYVSNGQGNHVAPAIDDVKIICSSENSLFYNNVPKIKKFFKSISILENNFKTGITNFNGLIVRPAQITVFKNYLNTYTFSSSQNNAITCNFIMPLDCININSLKIEIDTLYSSNIDQYINLGLGIILIEKGYVFYQHTSEFTNLSVFYSSGNNIRKKIHINVSQLINNCENNIYMIGLILYRHIQQSVQDNFSVVNISLLYQTNKNGLN